jgi:sorting nexin-4
MRGDSRNRGSSFGDSGAPLGSMSSATSSTSAIDRFQDWSINFLKAPHKPDKRFIAVKEKADKFEEDLGNVEKGVAKVVRREGDLESDYQDLATQMQKLVNLEPGIGAALTSFAASVEATSVALRELRQATDQDYMESLRDMASYTVSMKSLLKERNQKQLDFEALTEYLQKATTDRDMLASERGPPSLTSSPANFVRSKIEDVRGVDHEQSRRDRLRKSEMKIEDLNRAVDEARTTSEAFDDQVIKESAEFERIKAVEFRDTLGGLAESEITFWKGLVGTWEDFIKDMEKNDGQPR